jgi:biotin transport system substrate-specific component
MSAVSVHGPLVGRWLPARGLPRWLTMGLLAVLGTLLLWASAKVKVPFWPVPMTLQTFAVMALAAAYGFRLGLATILLYLAEGALGLPVFTDTPEKGIGLAYMMGPTGGYLAGFVLATAIVGRLADGGFHRSPPKLFGAMLLADAVVFACGLLWLGALIGWDKPVPAYGLYPFVLGDLVKIALAAALVPAAGRLLRR